MKKTNSRLKRRLWILGAVGVVSLLGLSSILGGSVMVETGAWGLSFGAEGQSPVGTVSQSRLAELDGALGIRLEAQDLTPENFNSARALYDLIRRKES